MKLNLKSRKILVLTDFFYPDSTGGANKMAYYSSKGLSGTGSKVVIITRKAKSDLLDKQTFNGMNIFRYEWKIRNPVQSLWYARKKIRFYLDAEYRKDLKPFDLVILHQPIAVYLIGSHPAVRGRPWLYNFHSPWGEEFMIKASHSGNANIGSKIRATVITKLLNRIERNTLQHCRKIIVLSQFMCSKLEHLHGHRDKIAVIPGGVDSQTFKPVPEYKEIRKELCLPDDKIILLTVRNLRPRMGLSNLIKAISLCGALRSKLHLIIAGSGQLEEKLKNQSEILGLTAEITFPGRISEENLVKYYQAADAFILPTKRLEGFGLATLEALASGLPAIATPVGATPEILSQFGKEWLSKDNSPKSLAQKISERVQWIIAHPQKYKILQQHIQTTVEKKYSWPTIISQWESVCSTLVP